MRHAARPLAPPGDVRPIATRRHRWCTRSVPALSFGEVEEIAAIVQRHAASSPIERLERRQAELLGRPWRPLVVHLDGRRADGFSELRLRSFGYAVVLSFTAQACRLGVDDETVLARRTLGEIRAVIQRRQRRGLGFLASDWVLPAFVLILPIVASILEQAWGRPGLAGVGVAIAATTLVAWLWWCHGYWSKRPIVVADRRREADWLDPPATESLAVLGTPAARVRSDETAGADRQPALLASRTAPRRPDRETA